MINKSVIVVVVVVVAIIAGLAGPREILESLRPVAGPLFFLTIIFSFAITFYLNRKDKIKIFHEHPLVPAGLFFFLPPLYDSVVAPIILGRVMVPKEGAGFYILFLFFIMLFFYSLVYFWKKGHKLLSASWLLFSIFLTAGVIDYSPEITLQAHLTHFFLTLSLICLWLFMVTRRYTLWQKVALFSLLIAVLLIGNLYTKALFFG